MSEVVEIIRVCFISFVAFCAMQSVGPGYANALRIEATKSYSARRIGSEWVEIEKSAPVAVEEAKLQFDDQNLVPQFLQYVAE